jgi:hypothetical protein
LAKGEFARASENRTYRNIFTAKTLDPGSLGQEGSVRAAGLFEDFPVAALISE